MLNCSWCNKKIGENDPLSAIDIKFQKGMDFSDREGEIIPVYLKSAVKNVSMIVTTSDSLAKKKGQDGLFPVCSDICGINLKEALNADLGK